ncbi:MAG: hypothetical protein EXR95_03455 [Gemmatimonadetes bacterium]|nr:hypothetical protein [Gemmatimonadota bacterium]
MGVAPVAFGVWAWTRYQDGAQTADDLASVSVIWVRDSLPSIAFRICNNGYRSLARVAFTAETSSSGGPPQDFVADTVLVQANCAVTTWPGNDSAADTVTARVTKVERDG